MFTTPENCTKIRVGFLASNKQDAINGYIIEKKQYKISIERIKLLTEHLV